MTLCMCHIHLARGETNCVGHPDNPKCPCLDKWKTLKRRYLGLPTELTKEEEK